MSVGQAGSTPSSGFDTLAGMATRKISPLVVSLIALLLVLAGVALGWRLVRGDDSLLRDVSFGEALITPNADGERDATRIAYSLSRNATVSIFFEGEAGRRYYFREDEPRGAGDYEVLFSGVVTPYELPGEQVQGEILARLLRDGDYSWTVSATDENGIVETASGSITIAEADTVLPDLRDFTVSPQTFTPNQDGISDRVTIQFYQTKEATVRVFVQGADGQEWPISEDERDVPRGEPGRHMYDYEGGVDNNAIPPPDGTYPVVAIAEDDEGQKIRVQRPLTISYGGVPMAQIFPPPIGDTLRMSATAVALCETVTFTVTVENYGSAPIRTTGPAPGTVYDSDWNYNTVGWPTESGAWRVGIGYENELTNYPYRWAVGNREDLEKIDGHLYLMPGERAVVTGSVRITGPLGVRNPQPMWAGLIHEDVTISQFNNRVDPHELRINLPDAAHIERCPERAVPEREEE